MKLTRWTDNSIIYEAEVKNIKELLQAALKSGANLCGANLCDADLSGAYLIYVQCGAYTTYIQPDNTRIGCEYHPNTDWRSWTPDDVKHMASDAKDWWTQYKPVIVAALDAITQEAPDDK